MAQDMSTTAIECLKILELQLLIANFCENSALAALVSTSKWLHSSLNTFLYRRNVESQKASSIWMAIKKYRDERFIISVIESAQRQNADLGSRYATTFDTLSHRGQTVNNV